VTKVAAYTPQPVPGLSGVVSLAVGSGHVCAVVDGGTVDCWGYEGNGGLGNPNSGNELVPTAIESLQFVDGGAMRAVTAGEDHACAVAEDGVTIWCWGAYAAEGSGIDPKVIGTLDASVAEMSAAKWITCARTLDGAVWCWGQNNSGVLGQGSDDAGLTALAPIKVPLSGPALQISVGGEHACVIDATHSMVCWGDDSLAELGPVAANDAGDVTALTTLPIGVGHVAKVGCGEGHTCALFDDGGIQCWGYDYTGALADPSLQGIQQYPVSIPKLAAAKDLFVHYDSACATLLDAGTVCWGNDQRSELGAGVGPTQDGGTPYGALPVVFP
jgi:alpha-tubulin suppressor-like RCC1 family protein